MSKRKYQAVHVKSLDWEKLCAQANGKQIVVGVDIAKEEQYAAVMLQDLSVLTTVRWKQPHEQALFVGLMGDLASMAAELVVVMEPSGVYGDTLRHSLLDDAIDVYRVSPKRVHDAAEVYDGVPSRHDAKAAAIIAKLHIDGASEAWPFRTDHERRVHAELRTLAVYRKEFNRNRDRLESLLSRYWPELPLILDLGSATMLELLKAHGCPKAVAADPQGSRDLMAKVGGNFLGLDKVDQVVRSAGTTVGVPMLHEEVELVRVVATECRRHQLLARQIELRIAKLVRDDEVTESMQAMVGKTTAAVLVAAVGSPTKYRSAAAYQKSLGLNLRESSSGTKKGGLHLTKRGPSMARLFLYMVALRFIQRDDIVRAWYARKVRRHGGQEKPKVVVAVMRKLSMALWHVAKGADFNAALLFDTRRLNVSGGEAL